VLKTHVLESSRVEPAPVRADHPELTVDHIEQIGDAGVKGSAGFPPPETRLVSSTPQNLSC